MCKYLETEQHDANGKWIDHRRNQRENNIFLEIKEDINTAYQNFWDIVKAVLRGKFIEISTYNQKPERNKVNKLIVHLKELEKQHQNNPKIVIKSEEGNKPNRHQKE